MYRAPWTDRETKSTNIQDWRDPFPCAETGKKTIYKTDEKKTAEPIGWRYNLKKPNTLSRYSRVFFRWFLCLQKKKKRPLENNIHLPKKSQVVVPSSNVFSDNSSILASFSEPTRKTFLAQKSSGARILDGLYFALHPRHLKMVAGRCSVSFRHRVERATPRTAYFSKLRVVSIELLEGC